MLKQKLIPLAGAALLLFSCGSKATVVNVDKQGGGTAADPDLISDSFNAEIGQNFTFNVSHESARKIDGKISCLYFVKSPVSSKRDSAVPETISLIDAKKEIKVTYNGEKMEESNKEVDDFVTGDEEGKYKYAPEGWSGAKWLLLFSHKDKKATDKIEISITSEIKESVTACYIMTN